MSKTGGAYAIVMAFTNRSCPWLLFAWWLPEQSNALQL
jgi:hypothetical protein